MPKKESAETVVAEAPAIEAELPPLPTPYIPAIPAPRPDETGYYGDADWVRIECGWDELKPREGFSPLWAEFDVSLTFDEAEAIPDPWTTPFGQLYPHVVPRVRAWNIKRRNRDTGESEPVPPPSEIGIEAFMYVRPRVMAWLAFTLRTIHLGGGPKEVSAPQPSGDGPSGPNGDA